MESSAPDHPCRILVVDDSDMNRDLTRAVLAGVCQVDCVADGQEALSALDAHAYDLVLMDLDMPVCDGLTATRAIRRRPGADSRTKIVALSARRDALRHADGGELAIQASLMRPIAPRDLLVSVKAALAKPSATPVWRIEEYEGLVDRLGVARMAEFLTTLRDECERLRAQIAAQPHADEALRRRAHDLSSTSGMMGFTALSEACRTMMLAPEGSAVGPDLMVVLERALHAMGAFLSCPATAA